MDADAGVALSIIRRCVSAGRFTLTRHVQERMDFRGIVWADILALLDAPQRVRHGGRDRQDRPKWIIGGTAADGLNLEIVCVLDTDDRGDRTVFVTIY